MSWQDKKGREMTHSPGESKDWPPGTSKWGSRFGVEPMENHRHPTQHNLSPVEGDPDSEEHARKAKWHYERAGVVTKEGKMAKRRPGSFAAAAVHDYKSQVKRHDEDNE